MAAGPVLSPACCLQGCSSCIFPPLLQVQGRAAWTLGHHVCPHSVVLRCSVSYKGDPPLAACYRSLNGAVEQIEKFSSDLHNLFHKIEAMHHSTSQELATEARQRDKQLKGMAAVPLWQKGCGVAIRAGDTQKAERSCSESAGGCQSLASLGHWTSWALPFTKQCPGDV